MPFFADIGAGTGLSTLLLARRGHAVFAVESNEDMRGQLAAMLSPYPKAKIVAAPAEATTLPGQSVDAVICAQALHWFEPGAFRAECRRICRPDGLVIALYNSMPNGSSALHCDSSANVFFARPTPAIRGLRTRTIWLIWPK